MICTVGVKARRWRALLTLFAVATAGLVAPVESGVAGAAPAPMVTSLPAGASRYVPLLPQYRVADTRPEMPEKDYTQIDASTIEIDIRAVPGVPADATAVVLNLTIVTASRGGFLQAYPADEAPPATSNVNCNVPGCTVANMAHVKLGTAAGSEGKVRVHRYDAMLAGVVVDVLGTYVPVDPAVNGGAVAGGRFVALDTALRVLDTRPDKGGVGSFLAAETRRVPLATNNGTGTMVVPASASAVVVNVTAARSASGFWTAYNASDAERPGTSTINIDRTGAGTRAAQAIVPISGGDTAIKVYSDKGGDLVLDVVGYFTGDTDTPSTDGLFVAGSPVRQLDTRNLSARAPWNGSTFEFSVAAPVANVSAAIVNLTATQPWDTGYIRAYAAGTQPPSTSNLNISIWPQTIANHAIVPVSTRGGAIYVNAGAHVIADVSGWYLGTPATPTLPVPVNPVAKFGDAAWLFAQQMPASLPVGIGPDPEAIADLGAAGTWPWKGRVGDDAHSILFAHRTSHTGPFRYIDKMNVGDVFSVKTVTGQWFRYRVVNETVIKPDYKTVEFVSSFWATGTMQLIACSRADGTPGGVAYRYLITARMIGIGEPSP